MIVTIITGVKPIIDKFIQYTIQYVNQSIFLGMPVALLAQGFTWIVRKKTLYLIKQNFICKTNLATLF